MLNPTYADYATHDESQFPELWAGCVGAWAPCLGASGTRLFDLSRRQNWGTLTNMDPPTDWVVSGGQMALDFDGSDDAVLAGAIAYSHPITVACWVRQTTRTGQHCFVQFTTSSGASPVFYVFFTGLIDLFTDSVSASNSITVLPALVPSTGEMFHYALVFSSATAWTAYINGNAIGSGNIAGFTPGTITGVNIGRRTGAATGTLNGQLDDIRIYNRALTPAEIRLLASRRGIAYQRRKRRYAFAQQATGKRRRLLLTGQT